MLADACRHAPAGASWMAVVVWRDGDGLIPDVPDAPDAPDAPDCRGSWPRSRRGQGGTGSRSSLFQTPPYKRIMSSASKMLKHARGMNRVSSLSHSVSQSLSPSGLVWRWNPRFNPTGHQLDAVLARAHRSFVPIFQACISSRCETLTCSRGAGLAGVRPCLASPRRSSGRADSWGGTWHRRWGRWACVWCCRIAAMRRMCSIFGRWETSAWWSCRRTLVCGTGTR